MPQYQYGPPPGWAQPQNAQPPAWAQQPQNYYNYQPFIPPRPAVYPQGGQYAYQQPGPWGQQQPYGGGLAVSQPPEQENPASHRSKKWPKLSAILAADTTLARFKLAGQKPSQEIIASTFYLYREVSANATPTTYMRFYSKDFPWSLEINTPQKDISCSDIWNAIWALMQQPIEDSEWGLLCTSGEAGKKRVEEIKKANKKRLDLNSFADKRILRCDYLGEHVWFAGLEKDDDYAKTRPLPGSEFAKHPVLEDTWLMKVKK